MASLAAHVVLLATLPGAEVNQSTPDARVLDVILVEPPRPLPAAPEPAPPPPSDAAPKSPAPTAAPRTEKHVRPPNKTAEAPRVSGGEPVIAPPEPPAEPPAMQPPAREPAAVPSTPGTVARSAPSPTAITPPAFNASYLRNPAPRYPLIARRNGEQGTVTLRVLVARDGTPERVTVEQTSGSRHLDSAALETVRTWRFTPARQGDEAIEAWVLVPIVFRLEGAS